MALGEFELIEEFFQRRCDQDSLIVGLGDDAAVLASDNRLAVATDTLLENIHFPAGGSPELIARRALRVNLSDMAAMGAMPRWFTLSLTLPEVQAGWLESFSAGLFEDAKTFDCTLIGGDTTRGPLNIGIQMLGEIVEGQEPLLRSGAQPGDLLAVTGTLGGGAAALETNLLSHDQTHEFSQAYWLPEPRISFAQKAGHLIHAAIDISDGLAADAGHLCRQSKRAAEIDLQYLPVSRALSEHWGDQARLKALIAGDDYELCLAISESDFKEAEAVAADCGHALTKVGVFNTTQTDPEAAVRILDNDGGIIEIASDGYRHF